MGGQGRGESKELTVSLGLHTIDSLMHADSLLHAAACSAYVWYNKLLLQPGTLRLKAACSVKMYTLHDMLGNFN